MDSSGADRDCSRSGGGVCADGVQGAGRAMAGSGCAILYFGIPDAARVKRRASHKMAEILVRAVDGSCPEFAANSRRGNIIVVQPDGHIWGNAECPPEYFIVKIPGLSDTTTRSKTAPWRMKVKFDVISSVGSTDTHTIRVSATEFNSHGEGKVTAEKVRAFLEKWGAKGIVGADNSATFTVKIFDAIQTAKFWGGLRVDDLFFTEKTYTLATGKHRVEINYSLKTFENQNEKDQFIRAVQENAALVSHDPASKVIVLDILRSKVQENFMADVRRRVESITLRRRRFRLSEAAMVEIGNAGGTMTVNSVKLNASVVDAIAE
jgi:hypothetical protein